MKVFVPFSEALIEELGLSIGDLVPFQLEYPCWRVNDSGRISEHSESVQDQTSTEVPA
ncbi:MAG: hypothetical protein O7B25_11335 [Gammaproteobacteria bacterium]|nr:hypothetical protein [Gammaproteobacteria bacterium]